MAVWVWVCACNGVQASRQRESHGALACRQGCGHQLLLPAGLPAAVSQIDVPMSNCINSGISKIYILTQFNSTSLNRHLARTYK